MVKFREVKYEDLDWIRKIRNEDSTRKYLGYPEKISKKQQELWFKNEKHKNYRIANVDNIDVGIIRFDEVDDYNGSIRIGCDVKPELRGRGYGYLILKTYIDYLFKSKKMYRIWLLVHEKNTIAINLYMKLNFRFEGVMRSYLKSKNQRFNYLSMSILRKEWKKK